MTGSMPTLQDRGAVSRGFGARRAWSLNEERVAIVGQPGGEAFVSAVSGHGGLRWCRDSAYGSSMTIEELTPGAPALLRSLVNNRAPSRIPLLQLLLADRIVMGSPAKVHMTGQGKRLLAAYETAQGNT
jgi:hypothetical protein